MKRYFTSDLHLGSALINKYAHRPFASADHALRTLLLNIDRICEPEDTLIHVGDFMLNGSDRHAEVEDKGLDHTFDWYVRAIPSRVFLISGNHDSGHNCDADCKSMVLDLNQNYRNVYVSHFPSDNKNYHGPHNCNGKTCIVLCGHVHDKWLLKYDALMNVLNINVGVDVWNYRPVRDAEITELLDFFLEHCTITPAMTRSFTYTRKEFDFFKANISAAIRLERKERRAEKLASKGLTPEDCENRRIEAMKKKGLI